MNYPEFIDNKRFYALDASKSELEQANALAESLKLLHVLTTKDFKSFDDLILEFLSTGLSIFGMKIGIVSRVEEDVYTVCQAVSPDNSLKPGDVFTVEGTYCREVVKTKRVLGFPNVGVIPELKNHPVYLNMKLESYLSAPIFVDKALFGTLNFTSTDKREHGFSSSERDLIAMMANSIGNFLQLKDREQALVATNDRMKRLVGHVAHDLRNPIGGISSLVELIELSDGDEEDRMYLQQIQSSAETSLEIIHSILETAAMGCGKIELDYNVVSLDKIVNASLDKFRDQLLRKNIDIKTKIQIIEIEGDEKRLDQVFTNLFSNLAKYTSVGGKVTIDVTDSEGFAKIKVTNTCGPTKAAKNEVDLNNSVGFGLEIVREILHLHHSELHLEQDSNIYKSTFAISQKNASHSTS